MQGINIDITGICWVIMAFAVYKIGVRALDLWEKQLNKKDSVEDLNKG